MLKDKDILHTLGELSEWVDVWYLADLQGPRAATANELAEMLPLDAMRYCYDRYGLLIKQRWRLPEQRMKSSSWDRFIRLRM